MDKFAVCVKIIKKVVGHLKKGTSGGFGKQPFTSCALIRTQPLGQKLLVKVVILAIESECKSLAN